MFFPHLSPIFFVTSAVPSMPAAIYVRDYVRTIVPFLPYLLCHVLQSPSFLEDRAVYFYYSDVGGPGFWDFPNGSTHDANRTCESL
jgi:hypothetical protein